MTHNQVVGSEVLRQFAYPLARACWEVGAPQIRNRGTVAGNILTASPANDTIPALIALCAQVTLQSAARGERTVPLDQFITGVRKTTIQPDELLKEISFPLLGETKRGTFIKYGLRRAQAISVAKVAVVLDIVEDLVRQARILMGSVAPTVVFAGESQEYLIGKALEPTIILRASEMAAAEAHPIDDIRGSAGYRLAIIRTLVKRALQQIRDGKERSDFPSRPVMLWGKSMGKSPSFEGSWDSRNSGIIDTIVNGQRYCVEGAVGKTLLRMLREDIGLTGTKEGCAEGECGACTVLLDGIAVMSCLVPAPRAHGARIITIEGLENGEKLHPVQQAFIDTGAVQCGYCSPGFVISGVALLDEIADPAKMEIQQALAGNLCRCTGYYKIVEAIERAARMKIDV